MMGHLNGFSKPDNPFKRAIPLNNTIDVSTLYGQFFENIDIFPYPLPSCLRIQHTFYIFFCMGGDFPFAHFHRLLANNSFDVTTLQLHTAIVLILYNGIRPLKEWEHVEKGLISNQNCFSRNFVQRTPPKVSWFQVIQLGNLSVGVKNQDVVISLEEING